MNNRPVYLLILLFFALAACKPHADPGVMNHSPEDRQADARTSGTELQGMFRYMADAAMFRDCRNDKSYAVSMEGQYIELERAYLNSGIEPGSEVMIRVEGRLLERPSMEENNNIIKLIVDKFNGIYPDSTCAPSVHAELLGTYWKLTEIDGNTVVTPANMTAAHMILAGTESRVHGNAGCNNFFGQYSRKDNSLSFSALGSTMMACPDTMETEKSFLSALGAANRYEISGLFLKLFADDQLLAQFEAVYL